MPRKLTMDMIPPKQKRTKPEPTIGDKPTSEIVSEIITAVKEGLVPPKKPRAKRVLSEEEKAKRCERLKLAREAKVAKRAAEQGKTDQ